MLRTTDLSFSYPGSGRILSFPDLSCSAGEVLLVLGRSGAGKSTLLALLAGLLQTGRGEIFISGENTSAFSKKKWDQFRGQRIGMVFQHPHFVNSVSAGTNVQLACTLTGGDVPPQRFEHLLGVLGIRHLAKNKPSSLSAGEKQRFGIARALLNNPSLILADEPTSALDDRNCEEVTQLLQDQATSNNAALVIVTHDQRLRDRFPNRVLL